MPDFLPAPQLPQGLAEEVLRLAAARGQASPLAAFAQAAGGVSQAYAARQKEKRQAMGPTLTPEQAIAAGFPAQMPGQMPPGQVGPAQPKTVGQVFPNGVPQTLVEQVNRRKEQEALAKMTTDRVLGAAGIKANAQTEDTATKLNVPVTDTTRALFKKAGLPLAGDAQQVRHEEYEAALKKVLEGQKEGAATAAADKKATAADKKQATADEKLWEGLNRAVNPANAPRGSLLGQAGTGNARADRALKTLSSKKVTPQMIDAVVADYAGIMQGGAPHEIALRQMGYGNLADRWARFQQYMQSKPQDVNTPEVVAQLRQLVTEIKQVDNQIISQNLDTVSKTHAGLIAKDGERWNKIRESVMKTTVGQEQAADKGAGAGQYDHLSDDELLKQLGQ